MQGKVSKAFLLAAGRGTRLRPLTDSVPKCLVPISGKPLLTFWIEICEKLEVLEVLINTHHLADQVRDWARRLTSPVKICLAHEETLLGSAGTVAANREFVGDDEFYVFYADNLVRTDLAELRSFHGRHGGVLTLGLFRSSTPRSCGIVTLDKAGCITSFEEKPSEPRSRLANAGIFVARRSLFEFLPMRGFADFGRDVMPRLVGKMYGCPLKGYLLDVGTPENYRRALEEWPRVAIRDTRGAAESEGPKESYPK